MLNPNILNMPDFVTYKNFVNQFKDQVNVIDINLLDDNDKEYFEYRKLNFQRSSRLEKTFVPSEETRQIFSNIIKKQKWILITESWCGDSAQNLPIIAKLAELNSLIDFKIVLRDSNLDFIDLYLTNGGRAIPKLIVFDENENELFRWGPRPVKAQNLFTKLKNEGQNKSDIYNQLHLWYGRNRGKEVEQEITSA